MIVILKKHPDEKQLNNLMAWLKSLNIAIHPSEGATHLVLGLVGDTSVVDIDLLRALDIVEDVKRVQEPYKNANRKFHEEDSVIPVGNTQVGGGVFSVIAGPCSIESEEQVCLIAAAVKASGATMLRGGAFKPRTSPYAFQGLRGHGLELLLEAKRLTGLPVVTEIMDLSQLPLFDEVDVIQVGARNMQNFELLKELGHTGKPILIKRGLANTLQELLMSAEYVMAGGNEKVILCERGIRTFETATRNTLDLSAVPMLKKLTHLPVIVDPSHATGISWMVKPMALAATAAGADGLMIEVHNDPKRALCDGAQSLTPEAFRDVMEGVRAVLPHAWHMPKEGV
ncbi:MAG: 3-deoxy-7-phosphoheptulonate synthase [Christensenellales bacterium]|nr:3-deoxy-7-phosphoheptulonate synthase [Clostridiales bacterium]MEE1441908.1 3-deoxy-7-phosphoheptulonate synthase [Christensenellales bacterium]HIR79936.1 3-deoxy-7-phosphoheptulonate synthase [Candidatus Limiplasma merdipullorum]